MLLGSIISGISDEDSILETLVSLDDLALLARMRAGGRRCRRVARQFRKCCRRKLRLPRRRYRVAVSDGRHEQVRRSGQGVPEIHPGDGAPDVEAILLLSALTWRER